MDVNEQPAMRGLYDTPYIPIALGYLPSGLVFGSISFIFGIPLYYVIALSILVYSGAVQSAFVGYWASGFSIFGILLTAFLLNTRHSFYGLHIERKNGPFKLLQIILVAPFITDEIYGLTVSSRSHEWKWLIKISIFAYFNWLIASICGYLIFIHLPIGYIADLTIGLSALFLSLFVPNIKRKNDVYVAMASISVALLVKISDMPDYAISLAILAGVITGAVLLKRNGDAR